MSILVIETEKPESLSIVAGECGVVRSAMHVDAYDAVLALLPKCTREQRRRLGLEDLRRINQRAAGVRLPEPKPGDAEANAVGRL